MIIWLFCLSLIFAQEPPDQAGFPEPALDEPSIGEPVGDGGAPLVSDEDVANQGSLVKRLTEPFNYSREGKRDPFLLPEAKEAPLLPGSYFGPFLPLQEIRIKDVVVKGIIMDRVKPKAFIEIPDERSEKKTQMVRIGVGDYLGENFGMVQAIQEGKIIIVQTLGEGDKKSTSTITLSIRK